jgi:hypothetical protein
MLKDCVGSLEVVHCLDIPVKICTGWERILDAVICLEASANTPRACCASLMIVPADWARVWTDRTWEGSRMEVHCLDVWASSWTCWEAALVGDQTLRTWVSTEIG